MSIKCMILFICCANVLYVEMARILVVVPVPSISHQVEFRPYTQELVKRGHEVVLITTDPSFPKGEAPANLTEIDVHDVAYGTKKLGFADKATGKTKDIFIQIKSFFEQFQQFFEAEVKSKELQDMLNDPNQHFDLIVIEACVKPALIFSHIYNAPVILFSTLPSFDMVSEFTGPAMHPLLYPTCLHQKVNNLTLWEKAQELYKHYLFEGAIRDLDIEGDKILRRQFGNDVPTIRELSKKVDMVFISEYHIWDSNRPVPPNVVYVGGLYPLDIPQELPQELKNYLDSSKNGVIYMSFGTNVNTALMSPQIVKTFVSVFAKLPYDVLVKWDVDKLPGASKNVRIAKWLPQSDLLRHPKVKIFIMQGGLQSTSDAINAGVPLIGMPMLGDQWFNSEQYVRLKIGYRLDMESLTEKKMIDAINTVIKDDSYRRNIVALRQLVRDQPQTTLDRAVWWTEYVIRHKGARHLRAPTALISYWDYFEIDLILALGTIVTLGFVLLMLSIYGLFLLVCTYYRKEKTD